MVDWYKHDIQDWANGTGSLDAASYRVYHVILQEIYLSEEPVSNNEHALAGACRQSLKTYRRALTKLVKTGKLSLDNGKLSNARAMQELEKIKANRQNASKGGQKSSGVSKTGRKPLKGHGQRTAALFEPNSPREERRGDKIHGGASAPFDRWPADYRDVFWKLYPNKVGKPKALAKLDACRKRGISWSELIEGLQRYIRDKPADRAWLNPETFINQERWADQPALPLTGIQNGTFATTASVTVRGSATAAFDRLIERASGRAPENARDEGKDAVVIIPPRPVQRR